MENNLDLLKQKLLKLIQLYESSMSTNKHLALQIKHLEKENAALKEQIVEINTATNAFKLTTFANTLSTDERERVELKKTINEYIKEIDFCIKTLDQ